MKKKIIVGDFSGIQNYLYDIQKNKSATKRLKGRSAFIELLLEKVRDDLKDVLGNCDEYITSGGKFIIFCNEFDQGKFDTYKKDLEEKLFKQFYGQLKIIFGVSEYGDDFKDSLSHAFEDLEKNKKRAFESMFLKGGKWDSKAFVFEDDRGTESVCTFSRGDLIEVHVGEHKILDTFIKEEELNGISRNTANDLLLSNYVCGKEVGNSLKIFDSEKLHLTPKIQHYIPTKTENGEIVIKSFEDLAGDGNFNKLACLKGDIDDLGKLVLFGLKEDNYEENYKKFSKLLDEFWDKTLYDLVQGKDLYVVYAGGDDFLILGKWDEIIQFYLDLQNKFKEEISDNQEVKDLLNKERNITFSGAINLFGPHDTFFTVVKQTSALLEEAKSGEKNQVNIFGKVIANDDFISLMMEATDFMNFYMHTESPTISTQALYFLLDTAKKIIIEDGKGKDEHESFYQFEEYGLWKAELFYMLGKNYKTKSEQSIKDELRKYFDGMLLNPTKFRGIKCHNGLFLERAGPKLFVMINYLLYKHRQQKFLSPNI